MIASCHSSIDIQPAINLQSLAMIELHQKVETFEDNRGKIVSAGNQRNVPFLLSCLESIGPLSCEEIVATKSIFNPFNPDFPAKLAIRFKEKKE